MIDESSAINIIDYWVSSKKGTCWVRTKNGVIIDTANLWRRFKGQSLNNLTNWLRDAKVMRI